MTERLWQQRVLDLAKFRGWIAYHTYDSRRSQPGFPDLVLLRRNRCVVTELKTDRGLVTEAQQHWLSAFEHVERLDTFLWRPADWPKVVEVLR